MWPWSSKEEKERRRRRKAQDPLIGAAQDGDVATLRKLLEKRRVNVDARDEDGHTALLIASRNGHAEAVKLLLKANATVNVRSDQDRTTPLHNASAKGHAQVVDLLLKANATVDVADNNGITPLHYATANKHTEVVQLLLKANATVDRTTDYLRTPLYVAASSGDIEFVELLLKHNAAVDVVDKNGHTPLSIAASNGHAKVVDLLLKHNAAVDVIDKDGQTPLHTGCTTGRANIVDLLLKANAAVDVATKNQDGATPLHIASWKGHAKVVKLLLEAEAPVDAIDKSGYVPLHNASLEGHAEVVRLLLAATANIDATTWRGETALHIACEGHRPEVTRLLLKSGANLHAQCMHNLTPLHVLIKPQKNVAVDSNTLETLQALVMHGATWDADLDEFVTSGRTRKEAPALKLCVLHWTQELADGLPLTNVPIEVVKRGDQNTRAYIDRLKSSREVVFRRKISLVGPSFAGKTSFVKSLISEKPQLEHLDDRTIGIDHFPYRFEQYVASRNETKIHEVTFWDFAGQDAYQVAHSLFFSPRTLFLVCVDLEAFTAAYLQASIMSNIKKQEVQLMDEFIERTVMKWIRMIVARQPDAELVFIATKADLLKGNIVTERLLRDTLMAKLKDAEATTQEMRGKVRAKEPSPSGVTGTVSGSNTVFISCTATNSVRLARARLEALICKSDRSFQMPDTYTQSLKTIVGMRLVAKSMDITSRINSVFAKVEALPEKLMLKADICRVILQALHDLGDVLWYEDLGVELFQDRVILDPLLLIDFIRQVINHNYKGQTMPHSDLKALPYWNGFTSKEQMKAMKQVLQKFHLVYSADDDRKMAWNSDLIVPAYWQTKTPASWLWLGDILRINPTQIGPSRERLSLSDILRVDPTKSEDGEAVRVHWEFHFEFGLPSSLFDHVVVASVTPDFTFDAGPDWIVYEEKDMTACRLMVGRDPSSLHRTIHVEAVVQEAASTTQEEELWDSFERLLNAFKDVMCNYSGLDISCFAWDDGHTKIGLQRLVQLSTIKSQCTRWMPSAKNWTSIRQIMQELLEDERAQLR